MKTISPLTKQIIQDIFQKQNILVHLGATLTKI